jgi:hypothetical protein
MTGSSAHGPQFFDANAPPAGGAGGAYGLELFLASEASAVVEHTKQ